MAGEADYADVVGKVFTAELRTEAKTLGLFLEDGLEFKIAEGMAAFIAVGGKGVVVLNGRFLYGLEVFLGGSAADYECDMIGRASSRAEALHLLDEEGNELFGIEQGLCLLIEVGFVGRAATFGHEEELVFIVLAGVDVDLGREVAACVHLLVHSEGGVLRVAEVVGGICEVHALRELLGVVAAGEDVLAFLAVDDGRAGVLAEGKLSLGGHLGVAEHGEGDKLVVFGGFGVAKDFCHHGVVLAAEHERIVVGALAGKHGEGFGIDHEEFMTAPVLDTYIVGGEVIVLRGVRPEGEHGGVVEWFCCHSCQFGLVRAMLLYG